MAAPGRRKVKPSRRSHGLIQHVLNCGVRSILVLLMLLFGIGVLTWGVAMPPVVHDSPSGSASRSRSSKNDVAVGLGLREAAVDITTKGLYDRIAFDDVDGGAWKQGWKVRYNGDEWNQEKLNIFVVPHSHNDPGWIRTFEEYYQERTRSILSTIVASLLKDKRRKFIWEEMSYLHRWWQDASPQEKAGLARLVKTGQLEIVGGGWVMNDEANSHYFAILEQMFAGNLWLVDTLGVTPRNSWAIDPFGHSSTMAYLLRRMSFENMLIQRTHYEVKKALAREQQLEFHWRQTWDSGNTTDILCHMMPFYSYDIPHTCGPEPAACCQFDYWRLPRVGGAQRCPWGSDPQEITRDNVGERARLLLDQYRKKSVLYKSSTLLVPLGDDFRYVTPVEAELQYNNYQALFDYINKHGQELKAQIQFGTLDDYFSTLKNEVSRRGRHAAGFFPALSGDFFTYADRVHDYWSGYYVSRPFYKAVDRVLEETLRAADILFTFSHSRCRSKGTSSSFPLLHAAGIESARRNLALFQHHDGVTGTAKDHVVEDYGQRMHNSLLQLQLFMAASIQRLLSSGGDECGAETAAAADLLEPETSRSEFNALPRKKPVMSTDGARVRRVVVYNPLEESVEQVVTMITEDPGICVYDSAWHPLESQLSPEMIQDSISMDRHRLHWSATLPAMGLATYFIVSAVYAPSSCRQATVANVTVYNSAAAFACPKAYSCSHGTSDEMVQISNEHQTLGFDTNNGLLRWISRDQQKLVMEEDISYYSSQGSGAYLFMPNGEAQSMVEAGGLLIITRGPLMQEVHSVPRSVLGSTASPPLSRSARLYSSASTSSVQGVVVEMQYHVELLENRYNNKEVIARFKTGLDTGSVFHSDLNGFQMIRRETYGKIPLQGNYYPMPSLAFLQGTDGRRFSIHSRQAVGVASLHSGWLEVMLDRRLTHDDGRGLGQGVMDNRPSNLVFHLLLERNVSHSPHPSLELSRTPSLLSNRMAAQLNYPLHAFLGNQAEHSSQGGGRSSSPLAWSALVQDLPCDFHIVSLKPLRPSKQDDVYGLILQRRGWDDSYCRQGCKTSTTGLDVSALFNQRDLAVSKVTATSLNFLHDNQTPHLGRRSKLGSRVDINPMEIQAYKISS